MEKEQQNALEGQVKKPVRTRSKTTKTSSKPTKRQSKNSKKADPVIGLGDVVEKVTKFTGIKQAVEAFKPDCGCDERRKKLNAMFSFYNPMTKDQKEKWLSVQDDILEATRGNILSKTTIGVINELYEEVFHRRAKVTSCSMCMKNRVDKLAKVYEQCES